MAILLTESDMAPEGRTHIAPAHFFSYYFPKSTTSCPRLLVSVCDATIDDEDATHEVAEKSKIHFRSRTYNAAHSHQRS